MAESIIGYTFFGGLLAAPLWVFFDAEERGRNSILWAAITLLSFVFFPIVLLVYVVTLGRDESRGLLPGARGRQYLFTAAFFFLTIVYIALVGLLYVALDTAWTGDLDGDEARVATAVLLAVLVFALPLWAFHWVRAQALLDEAADDQLRRTLFILERGYGGAVILIGTLVTIGFGIFLVFALFASIMSVYEGGRDPFISVIAFLPLTLLVVGYHWLAIFASPKYRALARGLAAAPPPALEAPSEEPVPTPSTPAAPARRFCGQCGAENPAANRFCSTCGAQLQVLAP